MKSFLLFFLLLFSFPIYSQPKLLPVYQLPEPPSLTVSQLSKSHDMISFKHKEGLVIYNPEKDEWKLFKYLQNQEEPDRIIFYDEKKDQPVEIKLSEPIYNIKCCEWFKDHLWIYSLDEESEYWFPELIKVDLDGNITKIASPDSGFTLIHAMKAYNDKLYVVRDSSLVSYSEDHDLKKIMDFDPIDWHGIVKSYESGFYIFRSRSGDGYYDLTGYTQIDLKSLTMKEISLPPSVFSRDRMYTDCLIYQDKLFKYCDDLQLVQGIDISAPERVKDYNIRDGITDRIKNLSEDEKETWFICPNSGIHRYIKKDSSWFNYTQFINYQDDSLGILDCEVLTINKDFVFIPMISNNRGIVKYLLFDRKNEDFMILNRDEFIRMFLFDGEKFVSYTGEILTEHPPNILNHIIDYQGDVWNLFLFLYDLPISGNFSYDNGNLIISNDRCTILSYQVRQPKFWYDGILIKLKNDSTIYFMLADKLIPDFDAVFHPYIIGGDAYRVFAGSRGNFTHGVLVYELQTNSCKTEKNFYEALGDFSFMQGTGKYVMAGSFYPGYSLYAVDVLTFGLFNLSKYISSTPRNCKSTQNYIYVATDAGLVYFDHDLNYMGKLYSDQCILSRTKLNLYLIAIDKVFLIKENTN